MSRRKLPVFLLVLAIVCSQALTGLLQAQDEPEERVYENIEENQQCFKCHGHTYYFYYNDFLDREVKDRMNPYFVLDSAEFYVSNHWNFICTDCHSYEYKNFPHPGELRFEPLPVCIDCHGGDETFARFNFEGIEEEFHKSVHSTKHSDDFTCWMCHNPHSYKINARTNENMQEFITYDNEICLSCHANVSKYRLLTTHDNPNVLTTHSWLPNQGLHFKNVRCIECHAEINDNILVAHNVQPKEKAVKLCVECHSKNSRLLASLYKLQFTDEYSVAGFANAEMLEESYIIGANRNVYLNRLSILFFGFALMFVLAHALLRIIIKRA